MTGLRIWQATLGAFVAVVYWVIVLALPATGDSWPTWVRVTVGLVGVGLTFYGVYTVRRGFMFRGDTRTDLVALAGVVLIFGIILILLAFMTSKNLDLTPSRRFAIGVGGAALAGFVFAVSLFDTLRAAASVPVVILLIGVVVWPQASTLIEESVQEAVITWMGVILATNGVAEAAKQIGESNAKAKSGGQSVDSPGDIARPP